MTQAAAKEGPSPAEAADGAVANGDAAPAPRARRPAAQDGVTPPPVTVEDPWRHLHPSRVWPD